MLSYDILVPTKGDIEIKSLLDERIEFTSIAQSYTMQIDWIYDLRELTTFEDVTDGELNTRFLYREYRYSIDRTNWSDWVELTPEVTNFDWLSSRTYFLQIRWTRMGDKPDGKIDLYRFYLNGKTAVNETSQPLIELKDAGQIVYYKPKEVYKVFDLTGYEAVVRGENDNRTLYIEFRWSQTNGRNWSNWMPLTEENLKALKPSPIRFFYIEYMLKREGNDYSDSIRVWDLYLKGSFQNVSQDYLKTNLLGIKECCWPEQVGECELPENFALDLTEDEKSKLWQPYMIKRALEIYNKISNSTNEVFGHEVEYFLTDPDERGEDVIYNENSLHNIICYDKIKVSVDQNEFPESNFAFNIYDMTLFDTFEVHIMKEQFKKTFGAERRPRRRDKLYFCQLNQWFEIEHAQPFRDFANASIFYRVMLKKAEDRANERAENTTIQNRIDELTKNNTLEDLLGDRIQEEKDKVAHREEIAPHSRENTRHSWNATIVKSLLENSTNIISGNYYDLSALEASQTGVTYKGIDKYMKKGDNRSWTFWINFTTYNAASEYIILDNLHGIWGWRITHFAGSNVLRINENQWSFDWTPENDTWYAFCWSWNQRERKLNLHVHQRRAEGYKAGALTSSDLTQVASNEWTITTPLEFELENKNEGYVYIWGGDYYITNIRMWSESLQLEKLNEIHNEQIPHRGDILMLSDNSNERIVMRNSPHN